MGKFEKHIGKGEPITIDGEEFILKPLGIEYIPDFFKAMKAFSGAKEGASTEEVLKNINQEGLESIKKIIEGTLKKSYPSENQEEMSIFGMKNMSLQFPKIIEINSATAPAEVGAIKKAQALERAQKNDSGQD